MDEIFKQKLIKFTKFQLFPEKFYLFNSVKYRVLYLEASVILVVLRFFDYNKTYK